MPDYAALAAQARGESAPAAVTPKTDYAALEKQARDTAVLMDPNRRPVSPEDFIKPSDGWPARLGDVGIGALKGVGATVAGNLELAANSGMIPGMRPNVQGIFSTEAERYPGFRRAEEATTATNTAQRIGKVAEVGAELLLPTGVAGKAAIEAIPTVSKAGAKFQEVMGAAKNIPVNTDAAGEAGLRIMQLAERGGGSLPRPVSQFLQRITHPDKLPLVYEEARDFASGISRLSANEMQRLSPAVAREVAGLRVALNKGVADAAAAAGKGREYAQAMTEYARAKQLHGIIDDVVTGAKRALPYAGAAAAGTWLTKKAMALMGGE